MLSSGSQDRNLGYDPWAYLLKVVRMCFSSISNPFSALMNNSTKFNISADITDLEMYMLWNLNKWFLFIFRKTFISLLEELKVKINCIGWGFPNSIVHVRQAWEKFDVDALKANNVIKMLKRFLNMLEFAVLFPLRTLF